MYSIDSITQSAMALDADERARFFEMITEYADILIKILPTAPLLQYIVTGETLERDPVMQVYDNWKLNR